MKNNSGQMKGFIISACNKKAADKCRKVVLRSTSASILFISGKSACGKTQLLRSVAKLYSDEYNKEAVLVSFQQMIDDLVECIKDRNEDKIYEIYSGSELLLVDNVQCVVGLDAVQEEFVKIFKKLRDMGVRIIMASEYSLDCYDVFQKLLTKEKDFAVRKMKEADFDLRKKVLRKVLIEEDVSVSKRMFFYLASDKKIRLSSLKGCALNIRLMKNLNNKITDKEIKDAVKKYER